MFILTLSDITGWHNSHLAWYSRFSYWNYIGARYFPCSLKQQTKKKADLFTSVSNETGIFHTVKLI